MRKEMVVGAVFMLAVALTAFGTIAVSGLDIFSPKTTWLVELKDLAGLQAGNDVRVLGNRMGVVRKITFDKSKYVFRLSLTMDADAPIQEGYRISVRDLSALGGKYLAVDPGAADKPPADVRNLVGTRGSSDIMGEIADVLAEFKKMTQAVTEAKGTMGKIIMQDDLYRDIKDTASSLKVIAERIEKGQGLVGRMINEDEIYVQVRSLVTKLNEGNSALAKLMKDESGVIVDDLKSASASIRSITAKADSGTGTIGRLINDPKLYENANTVVASASDMLQDIRSGKGVAGLLLTDPDARRNVGDTLENLRTVTGNVVDGKGTAGKFFADNELYDNLNGFAKHVSSASAKIDEGTGTLAKLINDPELYARAKQLLTRAIDAIENGRDSAPVSAIMSFIVGPFQ